MAAPASVAAGGGMMMMVKSTAYSTLAGVCCYLGLRQTAGMAAVSTPSTWAHHLAWPEMAQIFEMNFYHFEVPFVCSGLVSGWHEAALVVVYFHCFILVNTRRLFTQQIHLHCRTNGAH